MAWGHGVEPKYEHEIVTKLAIVAHCDSWGPERGAKFREFVESIQDDDVLYKFMDSKSHSGRLGYIRFDKSGKEVARFITSAWMS